MIVLILDVPQMQGVVVSRRFFSLPSSVVRLDDDDAFMYPFEDTSFDLTNAHLDSRCTQAVHWFELSRAGLFP